MATQEPTLQIHLELVESHTDPLLEEMCAQPLVFVLPLCTHLSASAWVWGAGAQIGMGSNGVPTAPLPCLGLNSKRLLIKVNTRDRHWGQAQLLTAFHTGRL